MKTLLIILASLLPCIVPDDSVRFTAEDRQLAEEILAKGHMTMERTALELLGTKYVEGSLEQTPEMLSVSLTGTDCILFVETCLALTLESREEKPSSEGFCDILRNLRYRNGTVNGYTSRIHYTSEWINQAQANEYLTDITKQCGGRQRTGFVNFMSTHPDSYPALKNNPDNVASIAAIEKTISASDCFFIPKAEIASKSVEIKDGDIIFFTTTVKGLDISHVGIAFHQNGHLTFIHASSTAGKVIINEKPLVDYTNGIRNIDGIRVARVNR